jgi:uncharacterized protein YbjT (DUF2867 family)
MTILVIGGTGMVGEQVLAHLNAVGDQTADVRVLTRSPEKARFATGVTAIKGDLSDLASVREAMQGISTLFLLVPNAAEELTQALQVLNVAREANVKGIVYLSVYKGGDYTDVPHFTSKYAVERMIEQCDLPATVLRPAYFIQNDARLKAPLTGPGVYGMPIGEKGISMVDVRDIGEAAALELLRRERAPQPLPRETYELVGSSVVNAQTVVSMWSAALGRAIHYAGNDLDVMEQRLKAAAPAWLAYDLRLMMQRYQDDGAVASAAEIARFSTLLGRAPRSYQDFVKEMAVEWANG